MYEVLIHKTSSGGKVEGTFIPDRTFDTLTEIDEFMEANYPGRFYTTRFAV